MWSFTYLLACDNGRKKLQVHEIVNLDSTDITESEHGLKKWDLWNEVVAVCRHGHSSHWTFWQLLLEWRLI